MTSPSSTSDWPVFKRYGDENLRQIALPLGGIGTGTIVLGGRGDWKHFEIVNRPAWGFTPEHTFFALRTEKAGEVFCRALEGPIPPEDYGDNGCGVPNHGVPRFQSAEFRGTYPLGEVVLQDDACPLEVKLQAFNPFVVGGVEASSWPVVVARFVLENRGDSPVSASICGSFQNFLGGDGVEQGPQDNINTFESEAGFCAMAARAPHLPDDSPYFGSFALAVLESDASSRTSWVKLNWGDSLLDFWDDFLADGRLENRDREDQVAPIASLCVQTELKAGESRAITFVWAWHFPNRLSWTPEGKEVNANTVLGTGHWGHMQGGDIVGNAYTNRFFDAQDVLRKFVPQLPALEAQTVMFARAFYGSDWPDEIKEAAGFNLSTLHSPTLFQTADGHFFGWEGVQNHFGSCFGNCTHVWNYEQATAFLFPEIARDFRRIEFEHMTDENGFMRFRVGQPLEKYARTACEVAAADGQCGTIIKLFREWKLSGDDKFLRELWPKARKALEFCWIEGGWDADADGVMEGCQHNTMDVEYFGPNPQIQFLYLAALRAGSEMADFLSENDFATECRRKADYGLRWTKENLWNGEYFEHLIVPASSPQAIAPGLMLGIGAADVHNPVLQLGAGCLIDQLFGVWLGEVCGLEPVLDTAFARQTLDTILKYNPRPANLFNHMRSFALNDEEALLMASYPRGNRPKRPFPYFSEVMTSFEHCVASHLLYLNEFEKGLKVIRNVRNRYDGRKRNPFNEAECGRHYARAMASYGHILGFTGFDFDGRTGTMSLRASDERTTWFWSVGSAWGTISQTPYGRKTEIALRVWGGQILLSAFKLRGVGIRDLKDIGRVGVGKSLTFTVVQIGP
jgi:non-lysosomal glucosylceramidase